MLSLAAAAGLSEPGPSSSSQPAALQAPPAAWSALLGPANHEFAHLLSPSAEHAGHGGRPAAPGPSRPRAPGPLNPSPFFAPPLMGASGAATGTTSDARVRPASSTTFGTCTRRISLSRTGW